MLEMEKLGGFPDASQEWWEGQYATSSITETILMRSEDLNELNKPYRSAGRPGGG
jgi:hypothetical protein